MIEVDKYLIYLPESQVLIYRIYKYYLQSDEIQLHLQDKHEMIPLHVHRELIEYIRRLYLRVF
jgi:phosphoenolpyruvate synthase/pyruvate phosphate dikinase